VSDDTPTQRMTTPVGAGADDPSAGSGDHPDDQKKGRGLLIALIAVGAALLIGIIILLIVLLGGGGTPVAVGTNTPTASDTASGTPTTTASASPSRTPTPTPTATHTAAPPPPTGPTLVSFTAVQSATGNQTVKCDSRTGNPIPLDFRWAGTGGSHVYIAVGATDDPKNNGQGWDLPTVGTQADFPYDLDYGCYNASQTFSLGIYDGAGHKSVKQVIIKNTGEVH
jgi:hypothetical protein